MAFLGLSKPALIALGSLGGFLGLGYISSRSRPSQNVGVAVPVRNRHVRARRCHVIAQSVARARRVLRVHRPVPSS